MEYGVHKTICINDSEQLKDFEGAKRKILKAFENKFLINRLLNCEPI